MLKCYWASVFTILASSLVLGCVRQVAHQSGDASDIKLETDDSESEATANLIDISDFLNKHINSIIQSARVKINPNRAAWTQSMKEELLREVQLRFSGPRKGSGVGVHWGNLGFEISVLTEIEAYLIETLVEEKHEIKFTKFKDSIYRDNPVGLLSWHVPSHMSDTTANHSIAPVVRVGSSLVGIDKFAHFLEQGYWYFDATRLGLLADATERREWGLFMEGDPDLDIDLHTKYKAIYGRYCPPCTRLGGFGYYGAKSTGVISYADIDVNEAGYRFYERLWADPAGYIFRLADYMSDRWNEQDNPSKFVAGVVVSPPMDPK